MVSLRSLFNPSFFFLVVYFFTAVVYVLNSILGLSPFFGFESQLIPGYISIFIFYVVVSVAAYLASRVRVKVDHGRLCYRVNQKTLVFVAHILFLVSSLSIVIYLYQLYSIGGFFFMKSVLIGDARLGGINVFRESASSVALNFLLPVVVSIYSFVYFQYGYRINKYIVISILVLVFLRSFFTAARLYLVWCFAPVVINYIYSSVGSRSINKAFVWVLPLFVLLVFIVQSSLRSFTGEGSMILYGLAQLVEYIVGGFHLSSALTIEGSPLSFPVETMRYLSTLSGGGWVETMDYYGFEQKWGKPGFNTYGVYGNAFIDYGFYCAIYAVFLGGFLGVSYRLYLARNIFGVCAFPVYMSIMLDAMRISAISVTQGIIPVFASLLVFLVYCFLSKLRVIR